MGNLETLKVRRGTVNNYYEELLDKTTISANTGLSIKTKWGYTTSAL
jgi:hypothetical protein